MQSHENLPCTPCWETHAEPYPRPPLQVILVDLITKLPRSHGHNTIMVVVDCLSKHTHVIPTTSDVTTSGVARLFRDHIWKLHGLPEEVINNRGTQFVSTFMHNLSQLLGIRVVASTAYHPQMDGQTERFNQEFEQFLQLFVNQHQDNWYEWLPRAKFAYNNWIHMSTHSSPFMLNTSQNPHLGVEPLRESHLETLNKNE